MYRYTMPAVLAAALWTMTFSPALAQAKTDSPQSGSPAQAQAQPGATAPAKTPAGTDVVGSVFGKQITWNDLLARMRKESAVQFTQVVAQAAGPKVASELFGDHPKPSVTLTQEDVYAAIRQNPPQPVVFALENMLQQDAFAQEAAKEGVTVTDAQVSTRIDRIFKTLRAQNRIPPGMTDDQFLAQQHVTRDQLASNIRPTLLAFGLVEKDMAKTLGHPLGPDDFIQARHILIKAPQITPTSTAADKKADADAKAKAQKIADDIKSGKKSFEQEAKQYSEDPGSKEKGGDLGVFMRGMMVPEFDAVVFKLKPGELSNPVRSSYGYHLIQVEKPGKDIPADQRADVLENRDRQMYQPFLTTLRQRANIVDNLRPAVPGMPMPGAGGPPRPNR